MVHSGLMEIVHPDLPGAQLNHGQRDEHLTIGDGCIDFRHVIRRMGGYQGNWIIESKSLESAVQSFSLLKSMLS